MAREIIILEQIPQTAQRSGFCDCIFVFPSEFIRLGTKYPITSLEGLDDATLAVFSVSEQLQITEGDLSFVNQGKITIRRGSTNAQRNQRLRRKWNSANDAFQQLVVVPKSFDVEYVGVAP